MSDNRKRSRSEDHELFPESDDEEIEDVPIEPTIPSMETADPEHLQELSLNILQQSYDFCNVFVPQQLQFIQKNIALANKRMLKARSVEDYQKLAMTAKLLYQSYSTLLEQSTVVFMSSYRPIQSLLVANKLLTSKESGSTTEGKTADETVEDTENEDEQELGDIEDGYSAYIDD